MNNVLFIIGAIVFITGIFGAVASNAYAQESNDSLKRLFFQENETPEVLLKEAQAGNAEAMFKYSSRCKDLKESAKWLKKSAQNGYARAQFYLGVCYTEGIGEIEVNSDSAKKWLMKACKQNFPMAKVYSYYKGIGVKPNKDKSLKELKRSAKAGYAESQAFLANVYSKEDSFNYEGIEKSEKKALYWMKKAAENGFEPTQLELGLVYLRQGKNEAAVKWLKKSALQGNFYAQWRLGKFFYEEKNLTEAKKWLQMAANLGDEDSEQLLAKIKEESTEAKPADKIKKEKPESKPAEIIEEEPSEEYPVSADSSSLSKTFVYQENETLDFLLKQAQAGNVDAMFKYAWRFDDDEEAPKWVKNAAQSGHVRAQFYLGHAYTEGDINGIKADEKLALKWLTSASQKGFPLAKAFCLYKGIGVELDKDKAFEELERSAKDGWVESQFALALVFSGEDYPFNFEKIDKNKDKAKYWLTKAAENGFAEAQFQLGMNYFEEKNENAVEWLRKAAVQSFPLAQYYLARAYYDGEIVEKNLAEAKKWAQKAADKFPFAKSLVKKIDGENENENDGDEEDDPFDDDSDDEDDPFL